MNDQEIITMLEHILIEFRAMDAENRKDYYDFYPAEMWSEALKIF